MHPDSDIPGERNGAPENGTAFENGTARDDGEARDSAAPHSSGRCRGVDPVALIAGIGTMLVSAYVLSDGASWLPGIDLRWIVAGGAVLIGVLMLGASMRVGRK